MLAHATCTRALTRRNQRAAEEMANRIRDELGGDASIEVGPRLDLTDRESIRDFAAKFKAAHDRLDVLVRALSECLGRGHGCAQFIGSRPPVPLGVRRGGDAVCHEQVSWCAPSIRGSQINNAGMGPMPDEKTADGVVIMVQTNYLGPYQLTRLLEDVLAKTAAAHGSARIVNVSSITHRLAFIPKYVGVPAHACYRSCQASKQRYLIQGPGRQSSPFVNCAQGGGLPPRVQKGPVRAHQARERALHLRGPAKVCSPGHRELCGGPG